MCILQCLDGMLNQLDLWYQLIYVSLLAFCWGELWIAESRAVTHSYSAGVLFHWILPSWETKLKLSTDDRHSHSDPRVEKQSPMQRCVLHSRLWVTDTEQQSQTGVLSWLSGLRPTCYLSRVWAFLDPRILILCKWWGSWCLCRSART